MANFQILANTLEIQQKGHIFWNMVKTEIQPKQLIFGNSD